MPEGPELRRSADELTKTLTGNFIVNAFVGKVGRYVKAAPVGFEDFVNDIREMGGCEVQEVNVKGKFMWWRVVFYDPGHMFKTKTWWIHCTYGMSGQWSNDETNHTAFGIYFNETGSPVDEEGNFVQPKALYFNDSRHYGTLKFVKDRDQHYKKLESLGPDMLSDPPDLDTFKERFMGKGHLTIAEALMNQSIVSGVGNYIKAEALYLAEISPHRLVRDMLPHSDYRRLREQIINVMRASYVNAGATFRSYRNPDGSEGDAQRRFVVYGHKTDPNGLPVVKEQTKDGRTTHWVPAIQS
jgi:DNA-formamidopyrimidine glycosylase